MSGRGGIAVQCPRCGDLEFDPPECERPADFGVQDLGMTWEEFQRMQANEWKFWAGVFLVAMVLIGAGVGWYLGA